MYPKITRRSRLRQVWQVLRYGGLLFVGVDAEEAERIMRAVNCGVLEKPQYLREAEGGLKEAVLDWYVSKVKDDEADANLYQAAMNYAYAIYGDLGDDGLEAERKFRGRP